MAADPTLVKGAIAVGKSMVGPDLSQYYAVKSAVDMSFIQGITDIFTANEKEAEAMMAKVNEPIEKFLTDVAAGGTPGSERLYDISVVEMDDLKAQYKLALKNKDTKSQHKIMGKLNRMINQNTQADTNILTVTKLINAGEINAAATGTGKFAALEKIIDFDNGNPGVTYEYDDNGYLTYRVQTDEHGEVIIKASDIEKMVIPHAKGHEAEFNKRRVDYFESGKTGGIFNFDEAKYDIASNIINDKRVFADLANRKWGNMEQSYKKALLTNKDLWSALKGAGDWNQDGTVNDQDFVTEENVATVVDAMTNINAVDKNGNSTFDWPLARDEFASFLTKELENKHKEGGDSVQPIAGGGGGGPDTPDIERENVKFGKVYESRAASQNILKSIKEGKKFTQGGFGYSFVDGKWWQGDVEIGTAEDLVLELGVNHPAFNPEGGLKTIGKAGSFKDINTAIRGVDDDDAAVNLTKLYGTNFTFTTPLNPLKERIKISTKDGEHSKSIDIDKPGAEQKIIDFMTEYGVSGEVKLPGTEKSVKGSKGNPISVTGAGMGLFTLPRGDKPVEGKYYKDSNGEAWVYRDGKFRKGKQTAMFLERGTGIGPRPKK